MEKFIGKQIKSIVLKLKLVMEQIVEIRGKFS
jgi:hypothetical protein